MNTNNYLLSTLFCGLVTLGGCSDIDDTATNNNASRAASEIEVEEGINPDDQMLAEADSFSHNHAFLYTQGNEAGINQVYIFEQHEDGAMEYRGKTATGGSGTSAALNSQGSVAIDRDAGYLYLTNAGDNTISSFEIREDGTLTLMHVTGSQGIQPVSIAIRNGLLYVVHSESSSIAGFRIGEGGELTFMPDSYRQLSAPASGPSQIVFSPNGKFLYITEKATNKITKFRISQTGRPGPRTSLDVLGNSPSGAAYGHSEFMIVANAEYGTQSAASLTSYGGGNLGNLANLGSAVPNFQTASGALAMTKHGYYSFVANIASDNISSYYVRTDGTLNLITESIPTGVSPLDIAITPDNISGFVLCGDQTIHSYLRLRGGNLHHTDKIGTLSPTSTGLAIW